MPDGVLHKQGIPRNFRAIPAALADRNDRTASLGSQPQENFHFDQIDIDIFAEASVDSRD